MRTKQKLLSLALVLAMALTLLPTMAFAANPVYTVTVGTATMTSAKGETAGHATLTISVPVDVAQNSDDTGTPIDPAPTGNDVATVSLSIAGPTGVTNPLAPSATYDATKKAFTATQDVTVAGEYTLTATVTAKTLPDATLEGLESPVEKTATATAVLKEDDPQPTAATLNSITYADGKLTATLSKDAGASITVSASVTDSEGTEVKAASDVTLAKVVDTNTVAYATDTPTSYTGTYDLSSLTTAGEYTISATYEKGTAKTCKYTVTDQGGGENPGPDPTPEVCDIQVSSARCEVLPGGTYLSLTWKLVKGDDVVTAPANAAFIVKIKQGETVMDGFEVKVGNPENYTGSPFATGTLSNNVYSIVDVRLNNNLAAGSYTAEVTAHQASTDINSRPGSTPVIAEAHGTTTPTNPTNPSTGIPNAGTVTDASSAQSAVNTLKNTSTDTIKANLESGDAAVENYAALEAAVVKATGLTVSVEPDRSTPSAAAAVTVTGAAFNAAPNAKAVALEVSGASRSYSLGRKYDATDAVAFNMTLTGVSNASKLDVPVVIQMPVPSGISSKRLVVLHYHGSSSTPEVLTHKITGKTLSFVVTGFSDFVIAETASSTTTSGGSSSGGGSASSGNISRPVVVTPPTTTTTPAGIFTDVPASHSFASQITWARDNSIMGGYADGSFRPNATTNRQQLWMVLARLAGEAPADMAAARDWAISAGISDGSAPDGSMSRQQLVTMLYRYAQSKEQATEGAADLSTYPDASAVASYASEALAWAVGNGIVTGTSDGRLNPEGTATRGQFAVMLYRFSHLS